MERIVAEDAVIKLPTGRENIKYTITYNNIANHNSPFIERIKDK